MTLNPGTRGRVEPKEARTVRCFGHTFKKGAPETVTDPALIEKLLREGSLRVTLIPPQAPPAQAGQNHPERSGRKDEAPQTKGGR